MSTHLLSNEFYEAVFGFSKSILPMSTFVYALCSGWWMRANDFKPLNITHENKKLAIINKVFVIRELFFIVIIIAIEHSHDATQSFKGCRRCCQYLNHNGRPNHLDSRHLAN